MQTLDRAAQEDSAAEVSAAVGAALERMLRLTSLLLCETPSGGGAPAALAGLSNLRQAYLSDGDGPLPDGPWITGLELLGASQQCINSSARLLAAAAQLKNICVLRPAAPRTQELWLWAQRHAPLRQVQFEREYGLWHRGTVPASVFRAVLGLNQRRPELDVIHTGPECMQTTFFRLFKITNMLDLL